MSDRFRELAASLSETSWVTNSKMYHIKPERLESALRKLADEIREEKMEIADEMVALFLSEIEKRPKLPIQLEQSGEYYDLWTDWITMVLKNCGAWQVAHKSKPPSEVEP